MPFRYIRHGALEKRTLSIYAFSAAGLIKQLPLLRVITEPIATVLIMRGLVFIPLTLWNLETLSGIRDCRSIETFILVTSVICLVMVIGYAMAAIFVGRAPTRC